MSDDRQSLEHLDRFSQTTLEADTLELWAAQPLYQIVRAVAPLHGFDALLPTVQVTIPLEAVREGANLQALLDDLDDRGLSMGRGEITPPATRKATR